MMYSLLHAFTPLILSHHRHEFVIVETIEFFDDEDDELPPPLALKDIVAMNKAREYMQQGGKQAGVTEAAAAAAGAQAAAPANGAVVQMDAEEQLMVQQAAQASLPSAAPDVDEERPPGHQVEVVGIHEVDMDEDEDDQPMKVVRNYQRADPRATTARLANGQVYDPTKFVVSPITGELIAVEEMAEHMRISLIDPRRGGG